LIEPFDLSTVFMGLDHREGMFVASATTNEARDARARR
jgi:hypothetical protein